MSVFLRSITFAVFAIVCLATSTTVRLRTRTIQQTDFLSSVEKINPADKSESVQFDRNSLAAGDRDDPDKTQPGIKTRSSSGAYRSTNS